MANPFFASLQLNCRTIAMEVCLFTLVSTVGLPARAQYSDNEGSARILSVNAISLRETSSFQVKRQFTGQVEARRKALLGFDRIGRIAEILVDRGDEVKKGQAIATLDCESMIAQRRKLEADLESAQALLRETKVGPRKETIDAARSSVEEQRSQYDYSFELMNRRERLFKKNLVSREEYDQAVATHRRWKATLDGAESRLQELLEGSRPERIEAQIANVSAIEAAIEQVNVEIKKSSLTSPFDGQVLMREFDEGSIASPGRNVITIVENRRLEARVGVPNGFLKNIGKGQSMQVECNGATFNATVQSIVSEVDATTRTQSVILSLGDDAWEKIVPGDTVRAAFVQEKQATGFWVPTESLVDGPRGLWNCYVVEKIGSDGLGTTKTRTVEVIHSAGENSLIAGSLMEGDVLVTSAPHRILSGQTVRPKIENHDQ